MADNAGLTETDVEDFITKLKQSESDKKVDQIQFFALKLEDAAEVPLSTLDAITLTIAPLLRSTSQLLVSAILTSFLPIYIPRLPASSTSSLHVALTQFLPILLEKVNDPKERVHSAASANIALLGRKCYEAEPGSTLVSSTGKGKEKETLTGYWERNVKEVMAGKGWRGKVECMKMLLSLRAEEKSRLQLKPWLGALVDLLEDGDGNVRDQARETVVALLSPASTPPAARSELKKLLSQRNVRKTIAEGIITRIFASDQGAPSAIASGSQTPSSEVPPTRSGTATPAMTEDDIEVVYVASGRDLENEFSKMAPHFDGKETEHNWAPREQSVVRIRGMLRGQAFNKYPDSFIAGLKAGLIEGISKTILSLRTTVAQQTCAVLQELAEQLSSSFDPFVEGLLPTLGKMAGFTKKIIAEKSQRALTAIITHGTASPRNFVSHIAAGIADKNIQTRQYSISHLKVLLEVHGSRSRNTIESTSGILEQIETAIKKSLADVNPQVRETGRATFWVFNGILPTKGHAILDGLDGMARKQLEKANPADAQAAVPVRPAAPTRPKASSTTAQLLAERRKAKAAELAAGRSGQDQQRTVSSPVPSSPSVQQKARSTSSQFVPQSKPAALARAITSPQTSPSLVSPQLQGSPSPSKAAVPRSVPRAQGSPLTRTRSSSSGQSSVSSRGSPVTSKSPLRQSEIASHLLSPSSSTSTGATLRTPTISRTGSASHTNGLGIYNDTPPSDNLIDLSSTPTRRNANSNGNLKAVADQAVSAAQQLLDLDDDAEAAYAAPITPARGIKTNGVNGHSHLLKTPLNNFLNGHSPGRPMWEDSPRPEALTPQMLSKLKERTHERSWWLKRQELLEKASPLKSKSNGDEEGEGIWDDVNALISGRPSLRNLQKLALFAEEHDIPLQGDAGLSESAKRLWDEDRLFDKVFDGLLDFLDPAKPVHLLEQTLVLLWELVQHQWILFEDRDDALIDALMRLRACQNPIILESTNSLISLLCETSEPLFFLSVVQGALKRYLSSHPTDEAPREPGVASGESAQASGYLFGLTALGLCVMRLPTEAVQIEGARLAPLITEALASETVTTRQAANTLILAIQTVLRDAQATLGLVPNLTDGQKNLATYLMEKNGIWSVPTVESVRDVGGEEDADGRRERVAGTMVGLLGRGVN